MSADQLASIEHGGLRPANWLLAGCVLLWVLGCDGATQPKQSRQATKPIRQASVEQQFQLLIGSGRWQQAEQLVLSELVRSPNDPKLLEMSARVAVQRQDWSAADERLQLLTETGVTLPDDLKAQRARARCETGQVMRAIDELAADTKRSPGLSRLLQRLYSIAGDLQGARNEAARLLGQRQVSPKEMFILASSFARYDKDDAMIQSTLKRNPDDLRPLLSSAVQDWLDKKTDQSVETLQRINTRHPTYQPAAALLAFLHAGDGRWTKARQVVQRFDLADTRHPRLLYVAGELADRDGDAELASACFHAALAGNGNVDRESASALARSLAEIEQNKIAAEIARMAEPLQRLYLACFDFAGRGVPSQRGAVDIAGLLIKLGRTDEAGWWLQLARQIQADPVEDADRILGQLNQALVNANNPSVRANGLPALLGQIAATIKQPSGRLRNAEVPIAHDSGANESQPSQQDELAVKPISLVDETSQRRLDFQYDCGDPNGQLGNHMHHMMGGGTAIADYDRNGWDDVYLAQAGGEALKTDSPLSDRLFLNHTGLFELASGSRIEQRGYGQGVAAGDVNEDGFTDLFIANVGPNQLLINNGDGTFRDATDLSGLTGSRWTSSVAIADVNADGLSDLIEVNYLQPDPVLSVLCDTPDRPGQACNPREFPPELDRVWLSRGDGSFSEVVLSAETGGRGMGVLVANLDGTPGVEILVSNDMSNNHLWAANVRDAGASFRDIATPRGLAYGADGTSQASMGIAWGDPNDDGRLDLLMTNFSDEKNSYYVQQAPGFFNDEVNTVGLAGPSLPMLGFGTVMQDFNCDGHLDMFVANGRFSYQPRGVTELAQRPQLFQHTGSKWTEIETTGDGYLAGVHIGRSVSVADFDRNGHPDLIIGHLGQPTTLLMDRSSPGNFVQLQLVGTSCNRDAVGAEISIETSLGNESVQRVGGFGYMATHSGFLNIGLLPDQQIKTVTVHWPGGQQQAFTGVSRNGRWRLIQASATPIAIELQ